MSYVEYYDGLVDQLKDNLTAEFNGYIEKLKSLEVDEIINHSEETSIKSKILSQVDFKKFPPETIRALYNAENVLDKIFDYTKTAGNVFGEITDNIIGNLAYMESQSQKREIQSLGDKITAVQGRQQEKNRHIVWSNLNLDFASWKDDLIQEYPTYSESALYEMMVDLNNEYLNDERMNLDVQLSGKIINIANLGLWDGRKNAYKMIDSGNIKDCLYSSTEMTEWYVDKYGDFRAEAVHHDGTNGYLYRVFKDDLTEDQIEDFQMKIIKGVLTEDDIEQCTNKIGDKIAKVYGFDIEKVKNTEELSR